MKPPRQNIRGGQVNCIRGYPEIVNLVYRLHSFSSITKTSSYQFEISD